MTDSAGGDRPDAARDAYVFGFPLVFDLDQVRRYVTTGVGSNPAAPFNTFSHAAGLAGPEDTFVTINNDTIYSMAQLDLSVGPVVLEVPPTGDRYHVLQLVDAWSNNIAYVGTRATGNDGGTYVVVPPGHVGELPDGVTVIEASTRVLSIVGRIACYGPDDVPAVRELQEKLVLRPLATDAPAPVGLPDVPSTGDDDLDWFARLLAYAETFPPSPSDAAYAAGFGGIGALAGLDEDTRRAGAAAGRALIEDVSHHGSSPVYAGWTVGAHAFDYNVDALGLGTVDAPEWKIADPTRRVVERAVAARLGLWGNHGYEAVYAQAFTDVDGVPLTGDRTYEIAFTQAPPVGAFWSITLYSVPDYYLVANPIDRYSIGDRTAGTVPDDAGLLTVVVSHAEPSEPARRANWLPAPDGGFRLVMRLYVPGPSILDGTYPFPPVRAVG
jgi:hypothetical protein